MFGNRLASRRRLAVAAVTLAASGLIATGAWS
jgi:hypothetical protein